MTRTGSLQIKTVDRRLGGLGLGTTQDIYRRRIEADMPPEQILDNALREGLKRAGYTVTGDSKTVLEVLLQEFSLSWAAEFGAQATASVSVEARVSVGDFLLASERYSQTRRTDKPWYQDGTQAGQLALSQALTANVNWIVGSPSLRDAIADPAAIREQMEARARDLQTAEQERKKRVLEEQIASERQRSQLEAKLEVERVRGQAEKEAARLRAESEAREKLRAERARAEARPAPDPVPSKRPRAAASPPLEERGTAGTCFAVNAEGLIVTALHVVRDAREIDVLMSNGKTLSAKVEARNSPLDIALLRVAEPTPDYLVLAPSRSVEIGEDVFTMGFPVADVLGEKPKFTAGTISALSGIRDEPAYLQISVPVQPGNSGGPLVDSHGQVVGMVVATVSFVPFVGRTGVVPQNINWAIKSDYIRPMFDAPSSADPEISSRHRAIEHTQRALCAVRARN